MKQRWELNNWSDVLEIRSGRNQKEVANPDGEYPILGSAGKVMGYADRYICEEGTTIIGRKGTINSPMFITSKFWNVDTAFGLHALEGLDKYFLFYFCQSFDFTELDKGSGRPSLVKSDLLKIKMPTPPLEEQKQIVAVLDKAFAAIDLAKANIEKNLQNAKELFQSKLNEIFTQKGEGWEEKTLKEIGETQTGSTPPTKDRDNYGNFIPFVKPAHFRDDGSIITGDSMLSEKGFKLARRFEKGSVLMVCIGATIGKTGYSSIEVTSNQQINALTPTEEYEPKFFYYALLTKAFYKKVIHASSQATLPIINKSKWESLPVPFPVDREKQKTIVKQLEQLKEKTQELELQYINKLESLVELKKSTLQKAFAGEL